ncbi:hypothetical protein GCM10011571_34940 [Marinithermofilum abyssi]|uniref:Type I phosphodiesterase / nucleotide pyrophosphatase n=1 Tax=Marinithermofilum abyssi TaxID=1571185 RepID=A0A8J2VGU6_9BACL|nr:alkaline phosphatase family protein [Marinithermofilum abyssi]GGE29776.1 hypothetical protein GCM10011571_34940 [Marinithermofilum abyssi]
MRWLIIPVIVAILVYGAVQWTKPKQKELDLAHIQAHKKRKVIWLLVDSIMAHAIDKGVQTGELPALSFLISHGQYYKDLVSSFPTMSVVIDSSYLTGTYPDQHYVPGLCWYDVREKRIVNYGTGLQEVLNNGMNQSLEDALINLNQKHLNPRQPTLYEELAPKKKQTASINGLVYRGPVEHRLYFPAWISIPTTMPESFKVKGPDFFAFGALSNPLEKKTTLPDGITNDLGFSDKYPLAVTKYLIQHDKLPDLSLVYLSDMDKSLHKKGPSDMSGIQKFDKELGELLDSFGSWDKPFKK